ncbi:hypothetical protein QFC20_006993 [Naganishia adeliensis]|uniref:Uncharacterized protein n=1 Tax=Naganishia adeliensis TaxID=92952 RepID=A0ACC2V3T2_9TREE|nr:hypothetical protein QFC20_006993 [Naganishia adeliensis]
MSDEEDDLFGENEDEDEDMEDDKDTEGRDSGNGQAGRDVMATDADAQRSPDSARKALNASESDTRTPNPTRSRTSSRSPVHTQHTTPHNSAAYQRRLNLLPPPATHPPTRQTLSLDPTIIIPHPCATYALAATPCLTTLLTGNADGYVRAFDFWASANSGAALSALQRGVANLGEGVNKAGVGRGYWRNEVEGEEGRRGLEGMRGRRSRGQAEPTERKRVKRAEPVYSLAVQSDGLWSLSGTESGPINLTTLRHAPGTIVHALQGPQGHTKAVSALCLSSDETSAFSGSWDQTIKVSTHACRRDAAANAAGKQWDLNTGQVIRTFTKHRGQISSMQLRPENVGAGMGNSLAPSLMVGTESEEKSASPIKEASAQEDTTQGQDTGDVEMDDGQKDEAEENGGGSDLGSLFGDEDGEKDEDADGENTKPAVQANDADFPFGGPPSAKNTKPPLGKPTNPFTAKPNIQAKQGLPTLTPTMYRQFSDDVMLVSAIDGEVALHDRRVAGNTLVGRLESSEKTPPWCMSACFSSDGQQVIAGRRNASLDVWDVRRMGRTGTTETPSLLRTLKHPATSGGSVDCVRLWNTSDLWQPDSNMKRTKSGVPFRIVAGHHGGTLSSIHIDPTGKYMITASGSRGWMGETTKVVLVHERK